jgi:hypothetical protein
MLWACPATYLKSSVLYIEPRVQVKRGIPKDIISILLHLGWQRAIFDMKHKQFPYVSLLVTSPLRTLRPIYRAGVPLPSRCYILYIFSNKYKY